MGERHHLRPQNTLCPYNFHLYTNLLGCNPLDMSAFLVRHCIRTYNALSDFQNPTHTQQNYQLLHKNPHLSQADLYHHYMYNYPDIPHIHFRPEPRRNQHMCHQIVWSPYNIPPHRTNISLIQGTHTQPPQHSRLLNFPHNHHYTILLFCVQYILYTAPRLLHRRYHRHNTQHKHLVWYHSEWLQGPHFHHLIPTNTINTFHLLNNTRHYMWNMYAILLRTHLDHPAHSRTIRHYHHHDIRHYIHMYKYNLLNILYTAIHHLHRRYRL